MQLLHNPKLINILCARFTEGWDGKKRDLKTSPLQLLTSRSLAMDACIISNSSSIIFVCKRKHKRSIGMLYG